jgi:NADPH-dependent F420 reductase
MKVAIIGTGNIGKALGGTLTRAGHDVTLAAQDVDKTREVAREVGASAAAQPVDAARDADVIVLAVPYGALDDVAREIKSEATDKVVIDVTNPLTPDYSGLATAGGPSAAEHLAKQLPKAKVVKAFNTILGSVQADPKALGTTVDGLFATDDAGARAKVAELLRSAGFRPVDAGSLDAARQLEAMAFLNISMQMAFNGEWRSAFVIVNPPEAAAKAA